MTDQSLKLVFLNKNYYNCRGSKPDFWTNSADSPLAHTPWVAVWRPCFPTSWPHMQACPAWPPARPSLLPPPFCWPCVEKKRHTHFYLLKANRLFSYRNVWFTRILSKAEGVPPLCTWPKTVVRVSKPNFFDTSWVEIVNTWLVIVYKWWDTENVPTITNLFHLLTCDRFTVAIHRSLCHNDDVQTGATASLLNGKNKTSSQVNSRKVSFFAISEHI